MQDYLWLYTVVQAQYDACRCATLSYPEPYVYVCSLESCTNSTNYCIKRNKWWIYSSSRNNLDRVEYKHIPQFRIFFHSKNYLFSTCLLYTSDAADDREV